MYETYFGLDRRPFAADPDPDCCYLSEGFAKASESLQRTLQRGEGVGLVVGAAGIGKTLLCQVLARKLESAFQVAVLTQTRLESPRDLLQAILFELGQPYRGMEEQELRLALAEQVARLRKGSDRKSGLVLLVDEAHLLPVRLLEELRLTTNLTANGRAPVRLCLAGQPTLEELLAQPALDSLNQRISVRAYLEGLGAEETARYVKHRVEWAGGRIDRLFTRDALEAIYQVSDGVPRSIGQLADHALILAYANQAGPVDGALVREAWSDLEQIPAQWPATVATPQHDQEQDIIEFGATSDEKPWPTTSAEDAFADGGHENAIEIGPGSQTAGAAANLGAAKPGAGASQRGAVEKTGVARSTGGAAGQAPRQSGGHGPAGFDIEESVPDRYAALDARRKSEPLGAFAPKDPRDVLAPLVVNEQVPPGERSVFSRPEELPGRRVADEAVQAELERMRATALEIDEPVVELDEACWSVGQQLGRIERTERELEQALADAAGGRPSDPAFSKSRKKQFGQLFTRLRRR